MNTLEFLSYLRSLDIQLTLNADRLRINAPKGALTPALRHQLQQRKAELLAFLQQANLPNTTILPITPISREQALPLSFAQQRLWVLDKLEEHTGAYNISDAWHITGALNLAALGQAITEIVSRHEILRTTFSMLNGQATQLIAPPPSRSEPPILSIVEVERSEFSSAEEQSSQVYKFMQQEAQDGFDLTTAPLMRVKLLRLSPTEHILFVTIHHIIYDGWSIAIFMRELTALYKAFLREMPSPLAALPVQYVDFAVWQRKWLQDEVLDTHLRYWLNQLQGAPPLLELPTDHPRPRLQTFNGQIERFELTAALSQKLKRLSTDAGTTLFMTLLTAFKVLLYRYSGQEDIVVGTPIANRNRRQTESLIGFFVNTLALRTQLYDEPTFLTLLERVRDVALDAYNYQDLPFEKLVEALQPERNTSYASIFQVMFILQNSPMPPLELPGLTLSPLQIEYHSAKFDLTLEMEEDGSTVQGFFEYNTDLFEQATISRMISHFITLLEGIVETPQLAVSELPLLTSDEQHKVLYEWNHTQADDFSDKTVHEMFEEQAKQRPDAIAVTYEGEILTYQELNRQANQVAHHLLSLGVGPEAPVGIAIERSLEMIVGLLGILKAGGMYVPLDPSYPKQRLAFMIEDAKLDFILSQQHLLDALPEVASQRQLICLDRDWPQIARHSPKNPTHHLSANSGLYIIYTSGSTGKPKGVMGLHQGAINRFKWMWERYPFEAEEICCQKTTLNFVDSVWEIFGPLLQGIPTVLIADAMLREPKELLNVLADNHISRLLLVPSLLRVMLDHSNDLQHKLPHLKYWATSGETLPFDLYERFVKAMPEAILLNIYGSSEVSADATCYDSRQAQGAELSNVPIGRPIDNMQVYILDRNRQLVPIGLPGELYIGGVGLARGYAGRPELTKERFIPNPFGQGLLYKSGDLGRYLPESSGAGSGNIEFLGRIDHQVKIRGFRIELGEIENVLSQHPAVREVVVMARDDTGRGEKQLVAYLVADLSVNRVLWQSSTQIELPTGQVLELATSDLSWNGIGLQKAPKTLEVGQKVRCALQLPSQFEPQWFEGRVTWRDNKSQAAGVIFETSSTERQLLRQNVKQMGEKQCGIVTDMRHREPRVPLHATCVVELLNGRKLNTLTENLSVGGVRLNTKNTAHRWRTGQKLQLHLQLPGRRKNISLKATVMWLKPTTEQVGLKFSASSEQSTLLRQSVEYLTSTQGLSLTHLRHFLKKQLLDYMIPQSFVIIDSFPLTPNGKINRLALPAPSNESKKVESEKSYLAPRDELELQLSKIWEKIFNRRQVGVRDNFFELGGHSLMAITLFSEIEKITNRRLPLTALLESPTIEQLTHKLRRDGYEPSWSSLVPLQPGGSKQPFFFVAPFVVSVLSLNHLSHYMAPDRPLYGLQPQGLDGKQAIHSTVEEMAAHYIEEMKSLQPNGPYMIGGHCAGSWVAFEMAAQLKEQGEEIGALIIVDAEPPNFEPPPTDLGYYFNRGLHYLQEGRFYYALEWKLKQRLEKKLGPQILSEQEELLKKVRAIHHKAYDNYIAPLYSGPMLFLRSHEWNSLKDTTWHKNWELLTTGKVESDIIPGAHSEMLNEPNVQILAQKLKNYLDKHEA